MGDDGLCPECGVYIGDVEMASGFCPHCGADLSDYTDEDLIEVEVEENWETDEV
jgi:hypothetical protein